MLSSGQAFTASTTVQSQLKTSVYPTPWTNEMLYGDPPAKYLIAALIFVGVGTKPFFAPFSGCSYPHEQSLLSSSLMAGHDDCFWPACQGGRRRGASAWLVHAE